MTWKRPASVPVGKVWIRFKGRERDGKPAHMYQIRDMGEYKQQCLDLMAETFLTDEPLCEVLGITRDPESMATIKSNWVKYMSQDVSLACFTEVDGQPDQLVGFNIIVIKCMDDEKVDFDKIKGESWKKLLITLIAAEESVDAFKFYNIDKYLTSTGLTVLPEHRGQNIAVKLFEARKLVAKAMGIQASVTRFTAITSQVLAKKAGFNVLAELPYTNLLQKGIDLTACPTPSAKLMGIRYQFDY